MKTNPAALASALALSTFSAAAQIPNPNVTGPIASTKVPGDPSHNYVFFSSNHELAVNGYVEEEYFIEGTANTYTTPTGATGTILRKERPGRRPRSARSRARSRFPPLSRTAARLVRGPQACRTPPLPCLHAKRTSGAAAAGAKAARAGKGQKGVTESADVRRR